MDEEQYSQQTAVSLPLENTAPLQRAYSWIGVCFAVLLVVSVGLQLLMAWLPFWIGGANNVVSSSPWWIWVSGVVPMYAVAFPLCGWMLSRLPAAAPEKHTFSKKQLLAFIPISVCLMYAGNMVGTMLSAFFG